MTSFSAFARPGCIHVVTDGLVTTASGEPGVGHLHKVFPLPAINAALVIRGAIDLTLGIRLALDIAAADMDRTAALIPDQLRIIRGHVEQAGVDIALADNIDVFLAGWSPENTAFCVYMCSGMDRPEAPAGSVHCLRGVVTPSLAVPVDFDDEREPAEHLARRIHAEQSASADHECRVGGFCQLTTVYRGRIETRIL